MSRARNIATLLDATGDVVAGSLDNISSKTITESQISDLGTYIEKSTFTVTVGGSAGTTDWSGTDPYVATVTVTGLLSADVPVVDLDLSSVAFADAATVQSEWGTVYRVEASADDTLKLYATAEPTQDLDLFIEVLR